MPVVPDFLSTVLDPPLRAAEGAHRPYVTLTFAQSLDAKIAGIGGKQLILSGKESMIMTHWMRTMHDAILVGIGTALNDDPQLNVRHLPPLSKDDPYRRLPRPVILDTQLRLSPTCKLLQNHNAGSGRRPWIFSATPDPDDLERWLSRRKALESAGAKVFLVSLDSGALSIPDVLRSLHEQGIQSLMVEGGANVIRNFLKTASCPSGAMVDMLIITVAPEIVGDGGISYSLDKIPHLQHLRTEVIGKDAVIALKVACNGLVSSSPPVIASNPSVSVRKLQASAALTGIADEISKLNATTRFAIDFNAELRSGKYGQANDDSEFKDAALKMLKTKESYLDHDSLVAMLDLCDTDVTKATTYLSIKRESLRKLWVKRELKNMGRQILDTMP